MGCKPCHDHKLAVYFTDAKLRTRILEKIGRLAFQVTIDTDGSSSTSGLSKQQPKRHNHQFILGDPGSTTMSTMMMSTTTKRRMGQIRSHLGPSGSCFLLGDTVLPDTVSLLLIRSGDIETNPGPDSCKDCGRNFTPKSVPVICT